MIKDHFSLYSSLFMDYRKVRIATTFRLWLKRDMTRKSAKRCKAFLIPFWQIRPFNELINLHLHIKHFPNDELYLI